MFTDIDSFSHQIFALSNRCTVLLDHIGGSSSFTPSHAADALKELGVATEELQVAIEELQQQNEKLNEALELAATERKRYQDLFHSAPQAYLITTLDGTIKEANRAAAQLIGIPGNFLEGKPLLIYVSEADRPLYWRELRQRQQYDSFREWQFWLQSRQQLLVRVACSTTVIRDLDDNPIGFRWILRDITEEQRLEALTSSRQAIDKDDPKNDTDLLQHYPIHTYKQGDLILLNSQSLWYVTQGWVKLTSLTETNKEILIGMIGAGMPFGAYLTTLPIYQATALSDVELVSISLTEIAASPDLARFLFSRTSNRLRQTEWLLSILAEPSIEQRLYQLLQLLQSEIGETIEGGVRLGVRFTHEELANACCSSRVTITRLLGKLQQQGKIGFDEQRRIILIDPSIVVSQVS